MIDFDENGDLVFIEDVEIIEEKSKVVTLDLFRDILKNITSSNEKLDWKIANKTYSTFVLNRCLANYDSTLQLAILLNQYSSTISKEQHYNILFDKFRPKKTRYLKMLKEPKSEIDLKKISQFYKININIMRGYFDLMSKKDIKDILKKIDNYEKDTIRRR